MANYFIQGNFGNKGNFEVLIPVPGIPEGSGLQHWFRDNDAQNVDVAWFQGNARSPITTTAAYYAGFIQSNYGNRGNFEAVNPEAGLKHWWRGNDTNNPVWQQGNAFQPIFLGDNGSATLIQSKFGNRGNFEVIAQTERGLEHWWRGNDDPNADTAWHQGNAGNPIVMSLGGTGPGFIQSNYGNFEVVVTVERGGGQIGLEHWWRDNGDPNNIDTAWHQGNAGNPIVTGVNGSATLIQSNFGNHGNFEVLVSTQRGLEHWWRDNDDPNNIDTAWHQGNAGNPIPPPPGQADRPALIQSNFGNKGNFEALIALYSPETQRPELQHWWRDNDDPNNIDTAWHQGNAGNPIVTGVLLL